jgi:hypothetical protein
MRVTRLVPLALAAALLVVPSQGLALPGTPGTPGGTGQETTIPAEGTEVFRALLDRTGIKPISRDEALGKLTPRFDDVIVIVLGHPSDLRGAADANWWVQMALERGGAVLIASDTPTKIPPAWQHQVDVLPARVECFDEKAILGGRTNCPFVVPISGRDPRFGRFAAEPDTVLGQIFGGDERRGSRPLTRVATNEPSLLQLSGFGGHFQFALARFPNRSFVRWGDKLEPLRDALFAVGGHGQAVNALAQRSDFLAMADHSVFINQMLLEPGTDNLELTYRVIDYLRGPDPNNPRESRRKRCLFIEDGLVKERFDTLPKALRRGMPVPQVNLWAIQDKLVDLGNAIVDDVQTRNVPDNILVGTFGLPAILRFLLLILTVVATVLILRRVWWHRKPVDIPPAPAVAGAPSGPPGVFDRRQKELLRRNNVYEPVRDLLREFFASVGVHGEPGPKHPRLAISDAIRKPESLRKAVKDFWKLAYGPAEVVTVNRWREMEPYFEKLRQAHADGKWQFVPEEATAGSVA